MGAQYRNTPAKAVKSSAEHHGQDQVGGNIYAPIPRKLPVHPAHAHLVTPVCVVHEEKDTGSGQYSDHNTDIKF